jgi:hypothetical protein
MDFKHPANPEHRGPFDDPDKHAGHSRNASKFLDVIATWRMPHLFESLKMKFSSYAWMLGLLAWAAGSASAQSTNKDTDYYGELGYLPLSINVGSISLKPKLARFTVGKNVHQNLAVEATYADTVSKADYYGLDISSHGYGVALKPKMTIANDTEVFARLGWSHSEIKAAHAGGSATNSGSKTTYGLGIQTAFSKDFYGQLDYMNYYRKDDITAKGWTVSVGMRF